MKNIIFSCVGLLLIVGFYACNGGSSDSVKNAKDANAARLDSQTAKKGPISSSAMISKTDADFLVDAASGSMMEVELGKIAESNSVHKRIKSFGAMMVADHGKGMAEIKRLAARRHITLPDSVSTHQQNEINDLKKKKGNDFDVAYIKLMVNDHNSDIKEFENQAGKGSDSLTRVFASSSLQMLRRHLDSANNLVSMLGINNVKVTPEPIPAH